MSLLFALLTVAAIFYMFWSLLGVLYKTGFRKRKLRNAAIAFGAVILCAVVFDIFSNREAVSEGYENVADKNSAKAAGVSDPVIWRQQRQAQKAIDDKKAADEAELSAAQTAAQLKVRAAEKQKELETEAAAAKKVEQEALLLQKKEEETARVKDEKCRQEISCWGEKAWSAGSVRCPEVIEKLAKWDFEWTDGWTEPKFSKYRWKDKDKGIVTLIGDKLKLQNGFGAWQHVTYTCDIDPVTKLISDASAF